MEKHIYLRKQITYFTFFLFLRTVTISEQVYWGGWLTKIYKWLLYSQAKSIIDVKSIPTCFCLLQKKILNCIQTENINKTDTIY